MEQHHGSGEKLDRRLNGLLAELARRLSETQQDQIIVQRDDLIAFGAGCADLMCDAGLLASWEPASAVICDGCEQGCVMPVHHRTRQEGRPDRPFIVCDKRSDIGRIIIDADRLRQWRTSLEQVAAVLARLLGTDRAAIRLVPDRAWQLGLFNFRSKHVEALMVACPSAIPFPGLTISLSEIPVGPEGSQISLSRLLRFQNHRLALNKTALNEAIGRRFKNTHVACEIIFERGDIILVNHVTGVRRGIASPNFNSSNDNAFAALYRNPCRTFTLNELRDEAREPTIADLHKLVENLKFDGLLRKLFFRVAADSIRFDRIVTIGQFAALGIDPKAIA
jgi:hypothetical protein